MRTKSTGNAKSYQVNCCFIPWLIFGMLAFATGLAQSAKAGSKPAAPTVPSVQEFNQQWQKMLHNEKWDQALAFCRGYGEDAALKVDALVCQANVEINRARKLNLGENNPKMGLRVGEAGQKYAYDPEGVKAALDDLEQALKLAPPRQDIWKGKAYILMVTGQHQELLQHLARTARECPGISPQDLNSYGNDYLDQQQNQKALDVFRILTEAFPQSFVAWSDYGVAFARIGKFDCALEAFKRGETFGQDDLTLTNLANLYIYLDEPAKALPYLQKMYETHPEEDVAQFRYLLGTAAVDIKQAQKLSGRMQGKPGQNLEMLKEKLKNGITREDALAGAKEYYQAKQYENALLLAVLGGDDPESDYVRAAVYEQIHYSQGVIKTLTRYLGRLPAERQGEKPDLEVNLGRAYFLEDQFKQAEEHVRKGIEGGSATTPNYYLLGRVLEGQGNPKAAAQAYEKAISINDDQEFVGWSKHYLAGVRAQTKSSAP